MSSTYTADNSPYRTPSTVRNPHTQSTESSPSVNHPQVYSPALSPNYIPPPSPTPSQLYAHPLPEEKYSHVAYPSPGGAYQQQHQYQQQNMYQQTYQHPYQQQQAYPEPMVHSYPDPELVDTVDEKLRPSSAGTVTKPTNNGRRRRIIWIGAIVILILIGAIIGIVVSMKDKDSGENSGNSSDGSTSRGQSSRPTPTPTNYSSSRPSSLIPVTIPSTPTTVSSIPVTVPTPTGGGGSRVQAPPIPPYPNFLSK
ncbi:hypothetical protein BGZ96_004382 [Linnemannia gamsii]|uniref:Uncharacterized protein n=1 Tax=Linnemannia gamsii TaxID=64522 RepID=A0ABQ7K6G5_9FUNG|nr:hypothetical protein BGZ96_004382 [Linnemannia gamsii]